MLNSKMLIYALGSADDEFIEEARLAMGYGMQRKASFRRKKLIRIALIAALIAALFAVTAYATGWFGLSARITPSAETQNAETSGSINGYISTNGYANSPEALAHAEWHEFCTEYRSTAHFSNAADTSWTRNEDEENYYYIYGAFDRSMMDKLLEIQDKYGIRLHNKAAYPQTDAHFYQVSGAGAFLLDDKMTFSCNYVYEDGSFKGEGFVSADNPEELFTVVRGAKAVLDPSGIRIINAENYEEWQYETACGVNVNLALRQKADSRGADIFVFCEEEDYIVTIMFYAPEADRSSAEAFADKFDYRALCAGDPELRLIRDTAPTAVKPKESLLTLKDFMEQPEYKAASEFYEFYRDYYDALDENDAFVEGFAGYQYHGEFPSGIAEVDAELERIAAEHKLIVPQQNLCYWYQMEIPAEIILPSGALYVERGTDPHEIYPEVDAQAYYDAIGFGNFSREENPSCLVKYDNGSFWLSEQVGKVGYNLHYIPKGCFYPLLMSFYSADVTSWTYEAECGEQVYISSGEQPPYPRWGQRSIVYETDNAYVIISVEGGTGEAYLLEMIADNIDFTAFK